jgi:hypothetical protein
MTTTDGAADAGPDAGGPATRWTFSFPVTNFTTPFVATGKDGSVAIGGTYTGAPTIGTTTLPQVTAGLGVFVLRLDPNGKLVWVKGWNPPAVGSDNAVILSAVAIGDDNRVYAAGDGANFSFGTNGAVPAAPSAAATERHGFIVRFAPVDGTVEGITVITAQLGASARQLKLDRAGNTMVVAGSFMGTLFFDGGGTVTTSATCMNTFCGVFAASYDGATPAATWAKSATIANGSATGTTKVHDVAVADDVVVAASFLGSSAAWTGTATTKPAAGLSGVEDALIVKLANNGGLVWMQVYGDPSTMSGGAPDGALPSFPNSVAIAKDKTVFLGGQFNKRVKLGSTTLVAPAPSSGTAQPTDGYFAGLSATTGDALWARAVSGPETEDVPSVMAMSGGDVIAAARYQSGSIVIDGKPLANPASDGAGIALLRYTTAGTLVAAVSSNGLQAGLGPKLSPLANDGVALGIGMTGKISLGPLSASSDGAGTKPSMFYAGFTP